MSTQILLHCTFTIMLIVADGLEKDRAQSCAEEKKETKRKSVSLWMYAIFCMLCMPKLKSHLTAIS